MYVKLCSIKNENDIRAVIDSGANAAGFLVGQVHSSNDFISPSKAAELVSLLPQQITPVLVTHQTKFESIADLIDETSITTVQLHGDFDVEQIKMLRSSLSHQIKLIGVFHVGVTALELLPSLCSYVDTILLDSCNPSTGQVGGTGMTHDWNQSAEIVRKATVPVILAGGLKPENVSAAIKKVKPFGVDVNSGVKDSQGFRSYERCISFVRNAKKALI